MHRVPAANHPGWTQVLLGEHVPQLQFLATKLLISRLSIEVKQDPSSAKMAECIRDLRAFFEKNQAQPRAMADLESITNRGGAA